MDSAELYDPATGHWTATGSLASARDGHTETLLASGKVLVAGGLGFGVRHPTYLSSAELYDLATGIWTATGSLATTRDYHTATLLPSGKVLVAGGFHGTSFPTSVDLMIRLRGVGQRQAASINHATNTQRRCCPRGR